MSSILTPTAKGASPIHRPAGRRSRRHRQGEGLARRTGSEGTPSRAGSSTAEAGTPGFHNTWNGIAKARARWSATLDLGSGWRSGCKTSATTRHAPSPTATPLNTSTGEQTYKKKTGKTVGRNTAIMELKLLAMIMGEAVRLGHADANPLVSLKLRRDKAAKKPELDRQGNQPKFGKRLKVEPEWMQTAFEIALHTGCRLAGNADSAELH